MSGKCGIRINQIGYEPNAEKEAVIDHPAADFFEVRTIDEGVMWKPVLRKALRHSSGGKAVADFSEITAPGDYQLVCGDVSADYREKGKNGQQSFSFVVKPGVYTHLARLLTGYFTWQRCGSEKGWAGKCHQEPAPLAGTGRTIDVRGGYHQSCDLRCWADGVSMSLYAYLRYAERMHPHWDDGILREELRHGCDYFLKLVSPEGFIYDSQFVPLGWGPRDYYDLPCNLGAHCNIAMLLARAARFFAAPDSEYADRCRTAAERISGFIERTDAFDTPYAPPVEPLPRGTQGANFYWQTYRNSATGIAGRAGIALELGQPETARERGEELVELQAREGYFRECVHSGRAAFSDCSYTFAIHGPAILVPLARLDRHRFGGALANYVEFLAAAFDTADFDWLPRFVHDRNSGGNALSHSTGSSHALQCAVLFAETANVLERPEFLKYAQRAFDWICGANPEEASYITGAGYNQKRNPVFGQFFPSTPQIPGGIQHVMEGEYDMPSVGMALWAVAALSTTGESFP